jgi:septal ring factor EnvC (AmiA/AmiB activator)
VRKESKEKDIQFNYEYRVKGMDYLEAIIDKRLLLDNSGDYVRACLNHYEHARGSNKSLELEKYLSWLPFRITSIKDTKEELEKKVNEIDKKANEIDKKVNEIDKNVKKILKYFEEKAESEANG